MKQGKKQYKILLENNKTKGPYTELEIETLIAAVLGLFEPLLILVMGGFVLVIVLAILLPIFDLNQLVQ